MGQFAWYLQESGALGLLRLFAPPLLVLFVLYYASHVLVLARLLRRRLGLWVDPITRRTGRLPDALLLLPTLLSKRDALDGLRHAIGSVLANGYPGRLTLCVAVDDSSLEPALVDELDAWMKTVEPGPDVELMLVRVPRRVGKAMAMELAIDRVEGEVRRGLRKRFPPLFFNLDADSALGPRALERLAFTLVTPRGPFRERPFIVTSNVVIRKEHYWQGFRNFFTVGGQLAIQAAREFTNSISLGRHTQRLIPVTSVSGALYCTWSQLHRDAPRFGRFLGTLRLRDWLLWWLGQPPPPFATAALEPLPESTIGPGDDTWISWLAMGARWNGDAIDLELPRTPLVALVEVLRSYVSRAIAFDPDAVVATSSPTTVRALFRQRVRWNSSRLWLVQRRGWSMLYSWNVAWPILLDLALLFLVHAGVVVGLLVLPLKHPPAAWLVVLVLLQLFYVALRGGVTLLAMAQNGGIRERWPLLLALPLSGPFHFVFNVVTTVVGFAQDVFGHGVNTGFAPEETLARCGTGRIALAYRTSRALRLAWRSLVHGDVPFGLFWFGWDETPWTTNGYTGWTNPAASKDPVKPRPSVAPVAARSP